MKTPAMLAANYITIFIDNDRIETTHGLEFDISYNLFPATCETDLDDYWMIILDTGDLYKVLYRINTDGSVFRVAAFTITAGSFIFIRVFG